MKRYRVIDQSTGLFRTGSYDDKSRAIAAAMELRGKSLEAEERYRTQDGNPTFPAHHFGVTEMETIWSTVDPEGSQDIV